MIGDDFTALLSHQPQTADQLEAALQIQPHNSSLHFVAAVTAYRRGHIKSCREHLAQALRFGFEWEEDTALDDAVHAALPDREFHDFENIFLDASEASPQNRWLSLTLPVYEWLNAREDRRSERAVVLAHLLSEPFDETSMTQGNDRLLRIINDLSQNTANAELTAELAKHLTAGELSKVAELVLALVLEHLGQFAEFFGLTTEEVQSSELQRLVLNLPLRMAVAVILLYTLSRPQEMLGIDKNLKNDALTAGLIAAAFITFYQQADGYRPAS